MLNVNLNLPKELEDSLQFISLASQRPQEFFIEDALLRYWEDLQDLSDALQSVKENKEGKYYTTEELLEIIKDGKEI